MDSLEDNKILETTLVVKVPSLADPNSEAPSTSSDQAVLTIQTIPKLEKCIRLLSGRNLNLLAIISTHKPKTLAELSRMSGRPKASLTRTLARLSDLGLLVLQKSKGRGKTPVLACHQIRLDVNLMAVEPSCKK